LNLQPQEKIINAAVFSQPGFASLEKQKIKSGTKINKKDLA